jgi:large subunit ribosomal protein L30
MAEAAKKAAQPRKPRVKKSGGGEGGLRVKQTRSGIGHAETYRRTLRALGLRHHQQEILVHDTPSVRGMLFKVRHLVKVTEEA